jgi:hypothetical protein
MEIDGVTGPAVNASTGYRRYGPWGECRTASVCSGNSPPKKTDRVIVGKVPAAAVHNHCSRSYAHCGDGRHYDE